MMNAENTDEAIDTYPTFNPAYAIEDLSNIRRTPPMHHVSAMNYHPLHTIPSQNSPTFEQGPATTSRSIYDHPLAAPTSTVTDNFLEQYQPQLPVSQRPISAAIASDIVTAEENVVQYHNDEYELSTATRAMIGTIYDDDDDDNDINGTFEQRASAWNSSETHADRTPVQPACTGVWASNDTIPTEFATVLDTEESYSIPYSQQQQQSRTNNVASNAKTTGMESESVSEAVRLQQQLLNDAKVASRIREEEEMLLAMKLSAACSGSASSSRNNPRTQTHPNYISSTYQRNEQQATVVEIASYDAYATVSPSSFGIGRINGEATAAQAEWIGSSSTTTSTAQTSANSLNSGTNHRFIHDENNNGGSSTEDVYEVAVLATAPMDQQLLDDEMIQLMGYTEEARIVNIPDDTTTTNRDYDDDRKPAAIPKRRSSKNQNRHHNRILLDQQQISRQQPDHLQTTSRVANIEHSTSTNEQSGLASQRFAQSQVSDVTPASVAGNDVTAEVVSIQDESDLHPILRFEASHGESTNSQAELVGLDHSFITTSIGDMQWNRCNRVSSSGSHSDSFAANSNHHSLVCTDYTTSNLDVGVVSIEDVNEIHPSDIDRFTAQDVTTNAELVGSLNVVPERFDDNFHVTDTIATSLNEVEVGATIVSETEADVVAIHSVEELHPADIDGVPIHSSADAELVGSINHININDVASVELTRGDSLFAIQRDLSADTDGNAVVADSIFTTEASVSDIGTVNYDPVIVATAFPDPHQPFLSPIEEAFDENLSALNDEDIARSLQEAENVSRTLHEDETLARTLQDENVARSMQDATGPIDNVTVSPMAPLNYVPDPGTVPSDTPHMNLNTFGSDAVNTDGRVPSTPDPRRVDLSLREISHDSTVSDSNSSSNLGNSISNSIGRGTTIVLGALFGDVTSTLGIRRQNTFENEHVRDIVRRTLLPCSVIFNQTTNMWVATIQTNQRALDEKNAAAASKSLRAFSMPSEKQARSLARSWTPPRMNIFSDYKFCHICKHKFALLRRACHCRNCGVCVCKDCSVQWPAKMVPETYNFKKEIMLNVCKSCDWLSVAFRLALLHGDYDRTMQLHATGNINLHTPFANVKGELFYPVHCAALGGNLDLLKFLVDDNCCPIRNIRVASSSRDSRKYVPIVTSKGRSLLGIALEVENLGILRYLVVEKGLSLSGDNDITIDLICRNFEKMLRVTPPNLSLAESHPIDSDQNSMETSNLPDLGELNGLEPMISHPSDLVNSSDTETHNATENVIPDGHSRGAISNDILHGDYGNPDEDCIICFDNAIDCVATPCGHSVCCLSCSSHLTVCPVCNSTASFIKIFRA